MTPPDFDHPEVPPLQGLVWLRAGWADFKAMPGVSLLHGIAMTAFGAMVLILAHDRFWLMAGAFTGFLLVAPVVAVGLYVLSRKREAGEPGRLADVHAVWLSGDRRLMLFGGLLALAGTGWVVTSAALITLYSPMPIKVPMDFIRHVMLGKDWLFEAWLLLGGLLAAPVFASSVIAMPLMLDRPVGVWQAVFTSWRVVNANPIPLAIWAGLLMGLAGLGMLLGLVGLIVFMPLAGHASWHAYRDLVKVRA